MSYGYEPVFMILLKILGGLHGLGWSFFFTQPNESGWKILDLTQSINQPMWVRSGWVRSADNFQKTSSLVKNWAFIN